MEIVIDFNEIIATLFTDTSNRTEVDHTSTDVYDYTFWFRFGAKRNETKENVMSK